MRKVLGLEFMVVNLTMMTLSGVIMVRLTTMMTPLRVMVRLTLSGGICGAKRPCLRIRPCVLHDVTFCILYLNRKRAAEEGLIFAFC